MQKRIIFTNLRKENTSRGFTLVELLVVLTIVAILAVAIVLILNPVEMLKKSRDTQRISDLNSIRSAIGLYLSTASIALVGGTGSDANCKDNATVATRRIWLSVGTETVGGGPYTSGSQSPAIAALPSDFGYFTQVSGTSGGLINGSGWIPVNIGSTTGGAAISNFPNDPSPQFASLTGLTNADRLYRYACNGSSASSAPSSFEVNANLESNAYTTAPNNEEQRDGGNNDLLLEVGTNLTLLPSGNNF